MLGSKIDETIGDESKFLDKADGPREPVRAGFQIYFGSVS